MGDTDDSMSNLRYYTWSERTVELKSLFGTVFPPPKIENCFPDVVEIFENIKNGLKTFYKTVFKIGILKLLYDVL